MKKIIATFCALLSFALAQNIPTIEPVECEGQYCYHGGSWKNGKWQRGEKRTDKISGHYNPCSNYPMNSYSKKWRDPRYDGEIINFDDSPVYDLENEQHKCMLYNIVNHGTEPEGINTILTITPQHLCRRCFDWQGLHGTGLLSYNLWSSDVEACPNDRGSCSCLTKFCGGKGKPRKPSKRPPKEPAKLSFALKNISFGANKEALLYIFAREDDFTEAMYEIKELRFTTPLGDGFSVFLPNKQFSCNQWSCSEEACSDCNGGAKIKVSNNSRKAGPFKLNPFILPYLGQYSSLHLKGANGDIIATAGRNKHNMGQPQGSNFFLDAALSAANCAYPRDNDDATVALFFSEGGHEASHLWGSLPLTCKLKIEDDSKTNTNNEGEFNARSSAQRSAITLKPSFGTATNTLELDKGDGAQLFGIKLEKDATSKRASFFVKANQGYQIPYQKLNEAIKKARDARPELKELSGWSTNSVELVETLSLYKNWDRNITIGENSVPLKGPFNISSNINQAQDGVKQALAPNHSKVRKTPKDNCQALEISGDFGCCEGCTSAIARPSRGQPPLILAFYRPYISERVSGKALGQGFDIADPNNDPGRRNNSGLFHQKRLSNGAVSKSSDSQKDIVGLFELFYVQNQRDADHIDKTTPLGIWTDPLTGTAHKPNTGPFRGFDAKVEELVFKYFMPASYLENPMRFSKKGMDYCVVRAGVNKISGRGAKDAEFEACSKSSEFSFYHKRSFEDNIIARPKQGTELVIDGKTQVNPFKAQGPAISRFGRSPGSLSSIQDWE